MGDVGHIGGGRIVFALRGVRAVQRLTSTAAKVVRDLVYPPGCAACGLPIADAGCLCSGCWCSVRFIERPYCEILGLPFGFDPGRGMVCAEAIANPPVFDRLRAVAVHDGAARDLVHRLKYGDRTDLAPMMAGWMKRAGGDDLARADAILPVPLHRWRLFSRQYNQSAELGRALARLSTKPFLPGVLVRVKRTSKQVGLSQTARAENVRGAFKVLESRRDAVFGRHIVLIDDVYTTGATVTAATRALKRAGAAEVTVLTFAMALAAPI
ncbi:ComF family protein [Rhizobium taibaishanense]|uniref:ComF family protein n=1 Tax=Allorhizobium taibaishanense TaxID=887144 RepID=A0A7W6MVM9_9HYPH|nr:ComF family protein [Allorhizobium taibaishanense]